MPATRRKGTLLLLSRLSKQALRATPESELGMSLRHYMALWSIPGSIPQQQLAEMLCIDANNTVILLNELETLGWVHRERDPADRRRHLVRITDEGQERLAHAVAAREIVEDDVLGPLSADERQTLHDLLTKALGD
jgi:DNA-binding MarR family transcriptional regulator